MSNLCIKFFTSVLTDETYYHQDTLQNKIKNTITTKHHKQQKEKNDD